NRLWQRQARVFNPHHDQQGIELCAEHLVDIGKCLKSQLLTHGDPRDLRTRVVTCDQSKSQLGGVVVAGGLGWARSASGRGHSRLTIGWVPDLRSTALLQLDEPGERSVAGGQDWLSVRFPPTGGG